MLIHKLLRVKTWQLFVLAVLAMVSLTAMMNIVISYWWWEELSTDTLLIGVINALVVSMLVVPVIIFLAMFSARTIFEKELLREEIEKRMAAQNALLDSEEKYRSLLASTDDSIYLVDRNCNYLFINKKHLKRLGISEESSVGLAYGEVHMPDETKWFEEKVDLVFETNQSYQFERKSKRDNRYFLLTMSPVHEPEGSPVAVTVVSKDITELKRMEEKLHAITLSDDLTGLYNRRGFYTLAEQQFKLADRIKRRAFLIYADVDNLKHINDTLGHQQGDSALTDVSNLLQETYRESDIIARMGGDEFAVLIIESADDSDRILSERLRENLSFFNFKESRDYKLSVSYGLVYYDPNTPKSLDELLLLADKLMYEQKKQKSVS